MLLGNYKQAHQIIREEGALLNEALQVEGITTADLDQWQSKQRGYFDSNLGKKSEENLHQITYVELLIEIQKLVVQRLFELHQLNLSNIGMSPS
jgi:hypothetical protein